MSAPRDRDDDENASTREIDGKRPRDDGDASIVVDAPPTTRPRTDDDDDDDDDGDGDARGVVAGVVDRRGAPVRVGDRLEVQWELAGGDDDDEDDEDRVATATWWPCEIARVDGDGDDDASVLTLMYDARDGFERESREVAFASGRAPLLTHADEPGATFRWRREGDESDDEEDDEDEDEENATGSAEDATTTLREIVDAQRAMDAACGESVEAAATAAFASLPMDLQLHVASAVANLRTKLVEKFTALTADRGAEYVITKEDVDALVRELGRDAGGTR